MTNHLKTLILTLCTAMLTPASMQADDITLHDQWLLNDTYKATVPSTVMGVLTANGEYAGILEGDAYKHIDRSRFDRSWTYTRRFSLTADQLAQHVLLRLDGISYRANIRLNGQLVAGKDSIYGTYCRHELDITPYIKEDNLLQIEVFRAQKGEPNAGYVDWNPRPADESMGIIRPVTLHLCRDIEVNNVGVRSEVNTATLREAWLYVSADLTNHADYAVTATLRGTIEQRRFALPVTLKAGETKTVRITPDMQPVLHVVNPRLWWCRDMGKPELYRLHVDVEHDGLVSDSAGVDFGIRQIDDYFTAEGNRGFRINGRQVLIRGAAWTDDIFMRDDDHSYDLQTDYVCDMGLNAIRMENVWGTSQRIFDLCDRKGIMILPGWSCHWEWEEYLGKPCDELYGGMTTPADRRLLNRYFHDQLTWLRNHPSIICWLVGSDKLCTPELELDYEQQLKQLYEGLPLVTSAKKLESTLTGSAGMKMEGPYDLVGPDYWFDPQAPGGAVGFNTETSIGAQLPQEESLQRMIGKPLWPLSSVWDYHCTASQFAMKTTKPLVDHIKGRFGEFTGIDDFLKKANLVNYDGTRSMFEAFRARVPGATGIIQWMLNSARPGIYWQLYDHYMVPNAAYYAVKKANKPCQLVYDYDHHVVLVGSGMQCPSVKASMRLYNTDGRLITSEEKQLRAMPRQPQQVFDVPKAQGNTFLFVTLSDSISNIVADNDYVLSQDNNVYNWDDGTWYATPITKYADCSALNNLQAAPCRMKVTTETIDGHPRTIISISNNSDKVAFFIRLTVTDKKGQLVVPAFYSDNFLSIEPRKTKVVTCDLNELTHLRGCRITMSGWNVPNQSIKY